MLDRQVRVPHAPLQAAACLTRPNRWLRAGVVLGGLRGGGFRGGLAEAGQPARLAFPGRALLSALSQDASFYAVADYRLRHGSLPLGWVYAGLVLLATRVLGFHSTVAVAAATLAAAALFNPVRRAVNRRFNRARYDADLTVAAFAARLKDAVDLDSVREDLASAVQEALEPAHILLWMNERG
jgi:hypothetical protein